MNFTHNHGLQYCKKMGLVLLGYVRTNKMRIYTPPPKKKAGQKIKEKGDNRVPRYGTPDYFASNYYFDLFRLMPVL